MSMTVSVSGGKVSLRHDQREYKEGKAPDNIDGSRSSLNEYFVSCNTTIEQAFNDFFKDSVDAYNVKQTRTDRKKLNYYDELKRGKNKETPVYEYVVQIGNKDNVQDTPEEEKVVDALREYAKGFQEQNLNFHVLSMALHRDEATPHLHISFIPYAEGYKTGLNMRCSTSKALETMGYKGEDRNMKSWKHTQEDRVEELMKIRGIDREVLHSARNRVDVQLYKETKDRAIADVKPELDKLKAEIIKVEKQLSRIKRQIDEKKIDKKRLNDEWNKIFHDVESIHREKEFAEEQLFESLEIIEDRKEEIAGLEKEIDHLKRKAAGVKDEIDRKQERIEILRRDIDKAEQMLPGIERLIKEKEKELAELPSVTEKKEELQLIETQIQFKKRKSDFLDERINERQNTAEFLDGKIENKRKKLADIPDPIEYRRQSAEARKELLGIQEDINTTRNNLKSVQADLERCRANQLQFLKDNNLLKEEQQQLINGYTDQDGKQHMGIKQLRQYKAQVIDQIKEARQTLDDLGGNIRATIRNIFAEAIDRMRMGKDIAENQLMGKNSNYTVALGMEKIEQDGHRRADRELVKHVADPVKAKLSEEVSKTEKEIADTVPNYVPHRHRGR